MNDKMKTAISIIAIACLCACTAPTEQTQIQPARTAYTTSTQQTKIPVPPIISYTPLTGPAHIQTTEWITYKGITDDDIIDYINYLKQVPNNDLEVALFTITWGVKNKNRPDLPKVESDQLAITFTILISELKRRGLWESFMEEIEKTITKEAELVRKLLDNEL